MKRGRTYWASVVPAVDGTEIDSCDDWGIFINERVASPLTDRRRLDFRFDQTESSGVAAMRELDRNLDLMSWLRTSRWEVLSTGFVCWVSPQLAGFAESVEDRTDLRPSARRMQ